MSAYTGESFDEYLDAPLPRPINWNTIDDKTAEAEWRELDRWVLWLKDTFGLPPSVVPPLWHRHDEMVWELSALHLHFAACYDPDAPPSGPINWMREFSDARHRLRDWVAVSGTRLDRDRPTRRTSWPGEPEDDSLGEVAIRDRRSDFAEFVRADLLRRRRAAPLRHYPAT